MLGGNCNDCCGVGWSCYAPDAGACCNGTTCLVVQQCDCDPTAGQIFQGIGTTCSPNPCDCLCDIDGSEYPLPDSVSVRFSNLTKTGGPGEIVSKASIEAADIPLTLIAPFVDRFDLPFCAPSFLPPDPCGTFCSGRSPGFAETLSITVGCGNAVSASAGLEIIVSKACEWSFTIAQNSLKLVSVDTSNSWCQGTIGLLSSSVHSFNARQGVFIGNNADGVFFSGTMTVSYSYNPLP